MRLSVRVSPLALADSVESGASEISTSSGAARTPASALFPHIAAPKVRKLGKPAPSQQNQRLNPVSGILETSSRLIHPHETRSFFVCRLVLRKPHFAEIAPKTPERSL